MASPEAHAPISKPPAVHRLEEDDGWDGSIEGDDADRKKFAHPAVMERMSSVANEQRAKFEVFLEWLVSNGAHFPDLYLKCYKSNVRGVHTRSVVPPSTQIMAIPLKCLITDATARATATGAKLKEIEYQLSAPNHNHVIVHILEGMERGDTFFQPFYDILPATFDNFPVFWSEEELEFLKGSDLVAQTRARIANIRDDYDAICAKLEGFDRFSFDQFLWCRTAVGSRNFSITVAGQKRTAMVPWADMLNHFRPRETSWTFDNAQGCFTMTSLRTLAKGQQVMDSYGKKCNSKFLLHYGFSIQSNREKDGTCMNQLPMHLNLKSDDPAIGAKSALLSRRRRFNMTMNYSDAGTKVRRTTSSSRGSRSRSLQRGAFELMDSSLTHVVHSLISLPLPLADGDAIRAHRGRDTRRDRADAARTRGAHHVPRERSTNDRLHCERNAHAAGTLPIDDRGGRRTSCIRRPRAVLQRAQCNYCGAR